MFFTLTLYMQDVLHYSPLKAGLAWGPFGIALLVGIAVSTKILPRFGVKRGLIFSYTVSGIGLVLLSRIGVTSNYLGILLPGMLVMAFGQGISFPGVQTAGLHGLGPQDAGLGSAVQNTSLQLGGSLGLAIFVTIGLRHTASQTQRSRPALHAATDGYSLALKLSAAAMFVGAILVVALFEHVKFIPPEELALEAAEAAAGEPSATLRHQWRDGLRREDVGPSSDRRRHSSRLRGWVQFLPRPRRRPESCHDRPNKSGWMRSSPRSPSSAPRGGAG